MEGVHIDFERLAGWVTFLSIKDYEDMIERYKKFDRQAQQIIDTMRVGIQQGMVNHAVSMVRTTYKDKDRILLEPTFRKEYPTYFKTTWKRIQGTLCSMSLF